MFNCLIVGACALFRNTLSRTGKSARIGAVDSDTGCPERSVLL